jgi:hypothetical protein
MRYCPVVHQPHFVSLGGIQLRLQHAHQVGIGHWGEGMMAHATVGKQRVSHKEMSMDDRSLVLRKCRRGNAETTIQLIHQRLDHGTNVAGCCGVKGRANFEVDLARTLFAQPAAGMQRLLHRRGRGYRSRFQGDHHRVRIDLRIVWGDIHGQDDPHTGAHQVVSQIGSAGEVIRDAAEDKGARQPL